MKDQLPVSTSRQLAYSFFVSFAANSLVIAVANMLFPGQVVLGTANLTVAWSIFHSMMALSLIVTLAVPLFEWKQAMIKRVLSTKDWMIGYLIVNFIGLWVISRFSEQFGLGVSAWWVALLLAAVFDFVQGMGMMLVYKK